jgi:hypothetical protein
MASKLYEKRLFLSVLILVPALMVTGCASDAGAGEPRASEASVAEPSDSPTAAEASAPDASALIASANNCELITAADVTALVGADMSIFNSGELCAYVDAPHNWSVAIALSDLGDPASASGYVDSIASMNPGSTPLGLGDKGVQLDDVYGGTWTKTQFVMADGATLVTVTVQGPGRSEPVPIADTLSTSILAQLNALG